MNTSMNPIQAQSSSSSPMAIVQGLTQVLSPVDREQVALEQAGDRVLAEEITADRDHPAIDVSAMDGYALYLDDARPGTLPIQGHARMGQPPIQQSRGAAVHIVTGAPVPLGAQVVIRREDVREQLTSIELPVGIKVSVGQNIRRRGENISRGAVVLQPGTALTYAGLGACAAFGRAKLMVRRRVRVALMITGDELLSVSDQPQPWQLRDSNGPALAAWLDALPWIDRLDMRRVPDDLPATVRALEESLQNADLVIMTGGVSMGDRDYAQVAVDRIGARMAFHGLPIRPGKPMLGATTREGKAILGLPGNPVSVLTTARRFALIVLRRLAGFAAADPLPPTVYLNQPVDSHPKLWLYRPVCLGGAGCAQLVPIQGSGDVVAAGRSEGIVEIPPQAAGSGPYNYYPWRT